MKTKYFMTKQVELLENSFSYSLIPSLLLKNKDYPRLAPSMHHFVIVDVVLDFASLTKPPECDMPGLERQLRISATQCLMRLTVHGCAGYFNNYVY